MANESEKNSEQQQQQQQGNNGGIMESISSKKHKRFTIQLISATKIDYWY